MLLFLHIFAVLISPFIGSYLQCRADRARTDCEDPRWSRCDHCGVRLAWNDLLPIWSWLSRRGRSRCCDKPLGRRLLVAEVMALVVTEWALLATTGMVSLVSILLGWTLLGLALFDWQNFRLPDIATLPLILVGIGLSAAGLTGPLLEHALGATIGYAVLVAIREAYRRWRGIEGLGLGDAKLLAAAGAWVGLFALPSVLLIACITGLLHAMALAGTADRMRRDLAIPFGPALCVGFWLTWLHGPLTAAIH